jgi:drug/metabolite transporter (DMT)-like permease
MLTVLAGLGSALSYALSDMLAQRVSRREGIVRVMLWILATGLAIVLPVALLVDGVPHGSGQWRAVAFSAAAGVMYLGAYSCLLLGLRRGDLSLVAALSSLQGLFAAVFAVIGGEQVTGLLVLGLALGVIGGALAAVQGRAKTAAGAGWALLSGLCFALVMVLFDRAGDVSWLTQAAVSRLTMVAVFLPAALILRQVSLPPKARPIAIGSGVLEVAGLVLVTVSIQLGPLSVAGVTSSQFATFAVLLGLMFLKERPRRHQLVGVACTLAAVTLLATVG